MRLRRRSRRLGFTNPSLSGSTCRKHCQSVPNSFVHSFGRVVTMHSRSTSEPAFLGCRDGQRFDIPKPPHSKNPLCILEFFEQHSLIPIEKLRSVQPHRMLQNVSQDIVVLATGQHVRAFGQMIPPPTTLRTCPDAPESCISGEPSPGTRTSFDRRPDPKTAGPES
jgi:hypothetical protein